MKRILPFVLFAAVAAVGWSQSNELLDDFLAKDTADAGTSLLLVAQAAGSLADGASAQDAMAWAAARPYGKHVAGLTADDPVSLGVFYAALFDAYGIRISAWTKSVRSPRRAAAAAEYLNYVSIGSLYYTRAMDPGEVLTAITKASSTEAAQ